VAIFNLNVSCHDWLTRNENKLKNFVTRKL